MLIAVAFVIAAWGTWSFSRPGSILYILDHPNHRSLHTLPKPRSGGVAILLAVAVTLLMADWWSGAAWPIAPIGIGALLVAIVSFLDDRKGVPVPIRFLAHIAAASVLFEGGLSGPTGWMHSPSALTRAGALALTIIFVVWMINLYNFMDGMDGFAGGMAVVGFGTFALLGLRAHAGGVALLCGLICAAAAGFLVFNFPPSRIFMGDTGSSILGFLAAAVTLWASGEGVFPLWIGILVFSPFVVDATVTLLRRLVAGEKVWEAHRSHFYQRLVGLGWTHRRTVLCEYVLMGSVSATALVAAGASDAVQLAVAAGWIVIYLGLIVVVSSLEHRGGSAVRQPS